MDERGVGHTGARRRSELGGDVGPEEAPDSPPRLSVPATAEGFAAAVTHLSAGLPAGPERSRPSARPYPPLVRVGPTDVPAGLRGAVAAGPELRLPATPAAPLVTAPLAYYLGADVRVEPREDARLVADGVERQLPGLPDLQRESAGLLRRAFRLDCLVRSAPDPAPVEGRRRLREAGYVPERLRDAGVGERLAAALALPAPGEESEGDGEWHLATYADPDATALTCLPHLLADLSLIYLPAATDIDAKGLLRCSLDDFFRGRVPDRDPPGGGIAPDDGTPTSASANGDANTDTDADRRPGVARADREVASVDVIQPEFRAGRIHGWLADGVPVEAFTPSPAAYEHRLEATAGDDLDVAVVLNDAAMADEREAVARIYQERASGFPVDVSLHRSVPVADLGRLLETDRDFLHYIGHCDIDGLECPDGTLDVQSLSGAGARAFFLNACGSYHQGRALVERGSVAGAVTMRSVLNRPAVTVGTAFVRLLLCGFGIERAIGLARRQITMSTDYGVVGDGTYTLADGPAAVVRLERTPEGFRTTYTPAVGRSPGGTYRAPLGDDGRRLLCRPSEAVLELEELLTVLDDLRCPVVYDGSLRWPESLARDLRL